MIRISSRMQAAIDQNGVTEARLAAAREGVRSDDLQRVDAELRCHGLMDADGALTSRGRAAAARASAALRHQLHETGTHVVAS